MLARPPGALPPPGGALAFSFLVTAPFGCAYGAMYNVASVLWKERQGGLRGGISRVYLWEAAGSVFGAVLFSFVLVEMYIAAPGGAGGREPPRHDDDAFPCEEPSNLVRRRRRSPAYSSSRPFRLDRSKKRRSDISGLPGRGALYIAIRRDRGDRARGDAIRFLGRGEDLLVSRGRAMRGDDPYSASPVRGAPVRASHRKLSRRGIGRSAQASVRGGNRLRRARRKPFRTVEGTEGRVRAKGRGSRRERGTPCESGSSVAGGSISRERSTLRLHHPDSPPPVNLQWNRFYTREFFEAVRTTLRSGRRVRVHASFLGEYAHGGAGGGS